MIETTYRCPVCSSCVVLTDVHGTWTSTCPGCAVSDCDACYIEGRGETPEDSLDDFEARMNESGFAARYVPAELASFVVPANDQSWAITVGSHVYQSLRTAEAYARRPYPGAATLPLYYGPLAATQKAANDQ